MISARDDGLIQAIGLSNVTLDHLVHALRATDVACVQNAYHLANQSSQPVLDECTRRGIAFVPFSPLGSGTLAHNSGTDASPAALVATRLGCTPAQVAIAWTLAHVAAHPGHPRNIIHRAPSREPGSYDDQPRRRSPEWLDT